MEIYLIQIQISLFPIYFILFHAYLFEERHNFSSLLVKPKRLNHPNWHHTHSSIRAYSLSVDSFTRQWLAFCVWEPSQRRKQCLSAIFLCPIPFSANFELLKAGPWRQSTLLGGQSLDFTYYSRFAALTWPGRVTASWCIFWGCGIY